MISGLLITYSGYPFTPSSLMPDNGLANLAGAMLQAGNSPYILDFNTIDIINRLMPEDVKEKFTDLFPAISSGNIDDTTIQQLRSVSKQLSQHKEKALEEIYHDIRYAINEKHPNFIGFKLWMGDGFIDCIRLAEMIKQEYPDIALYGGGPHAQLFKDIIFKKTAVFDAIAYSEGEQVINLLAQHSAGNLPLADIPSIIYQHNNEIITNRLERISDLNSTPFPVYDPEVYPAMQGDQKIKIFSLDESRGCPNHCAFCVHYELSGEQVRKKTVARIINEIKYFKETYNVKTFRFTGSNTPCELLADLAREIIKQKLDVTYTVFSTLEGMKEEDIATLKKSGLFGIFIGIESVDQKVLINDFEKRKDPQAIKDIIKTLQKNDIFVVASFIYPSPSSDAATKQITLDYILELFTDPLKSSVTIQFSAIFPPSKWGYDPEKYGFEVADIDKYLYDFMTFNVKQYLPPTLWDSLDYKMNGVPHKDLTRETSSLVQAVEKEGVLTQLLDEAAMMAKLLEHSPKEFKKKVAHSLFTGDFPEIRAMVSAINKNV